MAEIQPINLMITPVPNSSNVSIYVGYTVAASDHDLNPEQSYHEVCEIIGDDTPGDGTDDVLHTVFDTTTAFDGTHVYYTRAIQLYVPLSSLDEDNNGIFFQADEIRARVRLMPIPRVMQAPVPISQESNLVRLQMVVSPGVNNRR